MAPGETVNFVLNSLLNRRVQSGNLVALSVC